jgi:hypothetical protein
VLSRGAMVQRVTPGHRWHRCRRGGGAKVVHVRRGQRGRGAEVLRCSADMVADMDVLSRCRVNRCRAGGYGRTEVQRCPCAEVPRRCREVEVWRC